MRSRLAVEFAAALLGASLAGCSAGAPVEQAGGASASVRARDAWDGPRGIYVVLDASGSMLGSLPDGTPKIDAAKHALLDFARGDLGGRELALRIYGRRDRDDCQDSDIVVPLGATGDTLAEMNRAVVTLVPLGRTPIAFSLSEAARDFAGRGGDIVLISDGVESCGGDACALVRAWRRGGVPIRVHVIGLGLDEKSTAGLRCIAAEAGTEYGEANSTATLTEALVTIRASF
jgi:Mg-chelatase subunit ChlD